MSSMDQRIARLTEHTWDVLVVGGGVVGAGVARDAALRGLRVALIDRHDFAFGTSSRSSRLLHGGLRYLAQGRIGLVREASHEKCTLHRIAPHLALPLPFLFPTFRRRTWPRWQLSLGVKIYDRLTGGRNLGPSTTMSVRQIRTILPGLATDGLTGGVRYFDALTSDARLVIDTLRSAAQQGAVVNNYLEFVAAEMVSSGWRCQLRDLLQHEDGAIAARTIVNATGCWADQIPQSAVRLRLTKGIHVVVDQARFACPEAVVMMRGPRVLFAIPWGERVILGTTDTDYSGSLEDVRAEPRDIDYVLEVTNDTFPEARLKPEDVLSHWAGIRPLIAAGKSEFGSPSNTSRQHQILMSQPGWFDVAGGKLTTYRLMAEQVVDQIGRHLGRELPACVTARQPLLDSSQVAHVSAVVPPAVTSDLVRHFCDQEWAVHLEDVMARRSSWFYYHADVEPLSRQVAAWMGARLGWSPERQEKEVAEVLALTALDHSGQLPR